ncbi:MAG: ATP-dependent RecD-like DNA helicase [Clostridia bacterium]|nr:ATP-dependent RecD-like DNA helicase [Clostridia bacterium]
MERYEGDITNIIYQNDDNGYKVVEFENDNECFVAVGYLHGVAVGERVILTGNWINHNVYGEQLKVAMFEKKQPTTAEAIYKYLASGIIKGVRESTAKKIVEQFGDESLDVIAGHPAKLAKIKGISMDKALSIQHCYNEQVGASTLVMFLQSHGVSVSIASKVYKVFGGAAVEFISSNPYILCDEIEGISFKTADTIARKMDIDPSNNNRIKSGTVYTLKYNTQFGHSFLPRESLVAGAAEMLRCTKADVEHAINDLVEEGKLHCEEANGICRVYCMSHYMCEQGVAEKLAALNKFVYDYKDNEIEAQIDVVEKTQNIKFAELQREAVRCALKYSVLVITGGPGTGKTTIINGIIDLMHANGLSVTLTAPTGRAAKRMSQVCRCEAKTIHRLLEAGFSDIGDEVTFNIDEDKPIESDVIIVDEMSMVDIVLMSSLLKAVKIGTRLILVGDVNQLPSVGPGNVLKDIIDCGMIKVIRLSEIFRQAKESMIVLNAHAINKGEYPVCNVKDKDFYYASFADANAGYEYILSLCSTRLPNKYGYHPYDIQVLAASKKGINGVHNLNKGLQDLLNPPDNAKKEKQYGDTVFRVGDKVMQIKNNYDISWTMADGTIGSGVFNGDVGIIESIDDSVGTLAVVYDDEKYVVYDSKELDEIDLAYCVTVHKSQGSEFPVVVMPLYDVPYMLINRNLFYTGITRARDLVVLVGREDIMRKMVDNNRENKRFSGLKDKLIDEENRTQQLVF